MSVSEILILSAIVAVFAFVWMALIRASVRGGCRSGSCAATPDEEAKKDD